MSRIGKLPIKVPPGVNVTINSDDISVSGSKGELKQTKLSGIEIKQTDDEIMISIKKNSDIGLANQGLMRSLLSNMIKGVQEGFSKQLEINGVGYRVVVSGNTLKFNLGYSHDINYTLPVNVTASSEQNVITINGIDKQQVGQIAAEIRSLRKPEPYKGKGIKYVGERIIRKTGKSGKEK